MHRFLAYFFTALLLVQVLGAEVLVVSYELNQARITARFCVNKARPALRCHGQCHLARQLRRAEGADGPAPMAPAARVKFEVLPAPAPLVFAPSRRWPRAARRYAPPPAAGYADAPAPGVFRPPLG